MGILSKLGNLLRGSSDTEIVVQDDPYKKSRLVSEIINLIGTIQKINSFDSSIWNLSRLSRDDLERKSLGELEDMKKNLETRYSQLTKQTQGGNAQREAYNRALWTGEKPSNLTNHEFDRAQRNDGR